MGKQAGGSKASGKALALQSREIMSETRGSRNAYFQQLQDAIKTGGRGGTIPILNTALAGSDYGKATTLKDTGDALQRAGLAGSDFANPIMRATEISGGETTGATRDAFIRQLLGQAPSAALGAAQQGTEGLQQSATRNAQLKAAANQANSQAAAGGASAAGAIAGAVLLAALA